MSGRLYWRRASWNTSSSSATPPATFSCEITRSGKETGAQNLKNGIKIQNSESSLIMKLRRRILKNLDKNRSRKSKSYLKQKKRNLAMLMTSPPTKPEKNKPPCSMEKKIRIRSIMTTLAITNSSIKQPLMWGHLWGKRRTQMAITWKIRSKMKVGKTMKKRRKVMIMRMKIRVCWANKKKIAPEWADLPEAPANPKQLSWKNKSPDYSDYKP